MKRAWLKNGKKTLRDSIQPGMGMANLILNHAGSDVIVQGML